MSKKNSLLHICSYYIGNKLYKSLFQTLEKDFNQLVYIPIKDPKLIDVNIFSSNGTVFFYDPFLKPYHKYLYGLKIKSQASRIEINFSEKIADVKLIHAHTLFSDGGSAYILSKKYGIPYIVSIRNTDLNSFYKYAIHYRSLAHKILLNARKVVFISHAYRKLFFDILPKEIVRKIKRKCIVIPNGISEEFLKNLVLERDIKFIDLITTASLDKNKNISVLIKAVSRLKNEGKNVNLKIAGDGPLRQDLEALVHKKKLNNNVEFLGQVDVSTLKAHLDSSNIFILVSFKETFGISYIEAMARGLPIVYTRNQGVDGYFSQGEVGYSVNPNDVDAICTAIEKIIDNYKIISSKCNKLAQGFSWDSISNNYVDLYFNTIDSQI